MNSQDTEVKISDAVYEDLHKFIYKYLPEFKKDAQDYFEPEHGYEVPELSITFSIDAYGKSWAYQTGDNSYTGSCYGHPHWAVTWIFLDTDAEELYEDVCTQLEEYELVAG